MELINQRTQLNVMIIYLFLLLWFVYNIVYKTNVYEKRDLKIIHYIHQLQLFMHCNNWLELTLYFDDTMHFIIGVIAVYVHKA